MTDHNKHSEYSLEIRKIVFGIAFFMGFAMMYASGISAFGYDSMILQKKDSAYLDENYYSRIPVEESFSDSLSGKENSGYDTMISRYTATEFNYDEEKRDRVSWWSRVTRRVHDFLENLLPDWNLSFQKTIYYSLIVLGLLIFSYIFYRLILNRKVLGYKETKHEDIATPEWVEKRLMALNLNDYLDQALDAKNYKLAVRYLHLINLKKLAGKGIVEWQYRKTNTDFLQEIKDISLLEGFSRTARIYDYIWYGEFTVSEGDYQHYNQLFNQFNRRIK